MPKKYCIGLGILLVASVGIYIMVFYNFEDDVDYFLVNINSERVLFETDEKFLSVALDTSFMQCFFHKFSDKDWEKLEELTRFLAPAYLRLGGTDADRTIFSFNTTTTTNDYDFLNSTSCQDVLLKSNLIITGEDWIKLNKFAQKSKLNLIIDLNVLLRKGLQWDSSNADSLIRFSEKNGFSLDFQLGNEPNSFPHVFNVILTGSELARDFFGLRKLLNSLKAYSKSKLIGPDVTSPKNRTGMKYLEDSMKYLEEFLSKGEGAVDVISWHQYYLNGRTATLEDFIKPETFKLLLPQIESVSRLVQKYSPMKPIWISETSSAYGGGAPELSNRFAASFLWLDKLGLAARHNISVVVRQSLFKGYYALINENFHPSPDFWISILYKQLVGNRVLDVKVTQTGDEKFVRFYCHCVADDSPVNGSLVLYGMNLNNKTITFVLSGINVVNPVYSYIFRSEFQYLKSKTVTLNYQTLEYNRTVARDLVKMGKEDKFPLRLQSYSIGFWVLTESQVTACRR